MASSFFVRLVSISSIKEAPDGTIWILSRDFGLTHFDGVNFHTYDPSELGIMTNGYDLEIDPTGRLFIASGEGYQGSGLTEFIPTSATLKMNLFANKVLYKAGDELKLNLIITNYGPDETGDLYFVMMTPDGRIYSALDWSESLHPAASGFTFPEGFAMPMMELLKLTLPSKTPPVSAPGQYIFALAFTDPGTTYIKSKAIAFVEIGE